MSAETPVARPWGWYQTLRREPGHLIKVIHVEPGQRLSLQFHERRAERWVVVAGRPRVRVGQRVADLRPGDAVEIPAGARHRIENPGDAPAEILEVQLGDRLDEDDIVRIEDDYGRA